MPAPSTALATQRPDIQEAFAEFGLEEDRLGFIGDKILPVFEVPSQAGASGRIPLEQWLQDTDTTRNNSGAYNRMTWKFDPDSYFCVEHGLEGPVDARTLAMYAEYFDAEVITAALVRDRVLRAREQRIAAQIFNATTFASQVTPITNEWDKNHLSDSTAIVNVNDARNAVYDRTGLWPNALIINRKVFHNLRMLDEIIEAINSQGAGNPSKQTDVTVQMLSAVFDLEVLVAGGTGNTADEGQDASVDQIWSSEYAMVARVAKSRSYAEPCLGRTFHWNQDGSSPAGTIESYEEQQVRGTVLRCRMDSDEKLIYPECAQLLNNVTTL